MSDPRSTPANLRVAARHLAEIPDGAVRVTPRPRRVAKPVCDLLRRPNGPRDRQVLWGETVDEYESHDGWSFVQARKDGYVGYVPTADLGPDARTTHWVARPATHLYEAPDIKSPDRTTLSFGSRLTVLDETGAFAETADGFVPKVHLWPADRRFSDPVAVAELFLGTPYLWGGNSRFGIDCSGLVQTALIACGEACPGDSDQQQAVLGRDVADGRMEPGDLLFWKGHCALVAENSRLIHANAFHMAVSHEALPAAIERIRSQGDGPLTAHKRL
ncbi:NlpC/P60 family protein [Sedimentitalea sp. JM2-8]|uniref:NlpC/P60 family protein n=1 Tax=Sedimentitalea xiamensis TaxID=3050037 RepID=A0ABT7FKG0_9RHOB|nr:NlpC/P60 family protein [Sedimentitalea xiamensis]MDK3075625.1 NlpC/P60 family protein [Sedimentitalea xiamensis]